MLPRTALAVLSLSIKHVGFENWFLEIQTANQTKRPTKTIAVSHQ
jgi:hypothetical protein